MFQHIYLTGVMDDGTKRLPRVPLNSAKSIAIPLGSDVVIEVAVVDNAGVPVELATSSPTWTAWFSVVRNPDSCAQANGKVDYQLVAGGIKAETRNVVVFTIPKTALRKFPSGRYFYDVSLSFNGSRYQVVRISGLFLEASLRVP